MGDGKGIRQAKMEMKYGDEYFRAIVGTDVNIHPAVHVNKAENNTLVP